MHGKIMGKTIRPTYPMEVSIGILLLVFVLSMFLAHQIFEVHPASLNEGKSEYLGTFLVSLAVIVMLLVLWEEFLFPIHVRIDGAEVIFRNHRSKLRKQLLIYLAIPAIFTYIYLEYHVNMVRFVAWASICIIAPVAGKLISGLKNYNDFLKLTNEAITYKNNQKEGVHPISSVKQITLVKDERRVLHKIQLFLTDGTEVVIDIDEMEIEAFYDPIDKFINAHYQGLLQTNRTFQG